ncbi:MAG: DNA cytosine methyltransferase [Methylococcaceae bacterium]
MIRVIDFFSGCGGTSKGFELAGLNILAAIDSDKDAALTYRNNFPKSIFYCQDIRELETDTIASNILSKSEGPILFCGCAPCQPFSKQKKDKSNQDARISLLLEFLKFIKFFLPEYVFVENVPGLQNVYGKLGPFDKFVSELEKNQYHVEFKVISSQDYGVPQKRRRLVLIATRLGKISFPLPTHGEGRINPKYTTVADKIRHLPPIEAGEIHNLDSNHRAAKLSPINLKRIKSTPEGGDRRHWSADMQLNCHKGYIGHSDVYGRMRWESPASGLTTRCISYSNGRFGHPEQNRAISVREAACLQTFPEDFVFSGNLNSMAKQIGNAVPVELARVFGRNFLLHYQNYCQTKDTKVA